MESLAISARMSLANGEPVSVGIGVRVLSEAARALHRLHQQGRTFGRNFSAQDILLDSDGRVTLAEQNAGRGRDVREDIYALGVILRELIAASRPPMALLEVVARAISLRPEARQPSAEIFAAEISAAVAPASVQELAAWISRNAPDPVTLEAQQNADRTFTRQAPRIDETNDRSYDHSQSTDPSESGLRIPFGTATQEPVDFTHTVSREISQSDPDELAAREKRSERRGRLKSGKLRRRLIWAGVGACLPLFVVLAWMARRRFVHEPSVRAAVAIEGRAFGSDLRFDRSVPLPPVRPDPLFFWGKIVIPDRSKPAKGPVLSKVREPKVREPKVVEKVEVVEKVVEPPKVVEAPKNIGRVAVRVMRDGSSSRMLVYVDGKPALQSPNMIELSPGTHTFEVRPKGRPAIKKSIDVRLGDTSEIVLDAGEDF